MSGCQCIDSCTVLINLPLEPFYIYNLNSVIHRAHCILPACLSVISKDSNGVIKPALPSSLSLSLHLDKTYVLNNINIIFVGQGIYFKNFIFPQYK